MRKFWFSKWGSLSEDILPKDYMKTLVRYLLGQLHIYRISQKPILIFSSRRGGSTLLMEMIASQPHIDYCYEPLNFWRKLHPHFADLPHPYGGRFLTLSEEDEQRLKRYFENIISGKIKVFNSWNIFDSKHSIFVKRVVIKILFANALIDWFSKTFNSNIIWLIRHPVAFALSCIKLKWGDDIEVFLSNDKFLQYLSKDQLKVAMRIRNSDSNFERLVLEWCLENLYPLRVFRERSWLTLTYEELIMRPKQISELICQYCNLPDPEGMSKIVHRPSSTTFLGQSKESIQKMNFYELLQRWLKEVPESELNRIQEVLDVFDIWVYNAFNPWPHPQICHFGPLGEI